MMDTSKTLLLSVVLHLFFAKETLAGAQCNASSGPSGSTTCVKLQEYNRYKWAACTTNAYIKQQTRYRHSCKDTSATYRWYPYMLETQNKATGYVAIDCSCTLSHVTTVSPTATLTSACYSPSGYDSHWFSDCLKRKYPCKSSRTVYAVKYAQIFSAVYEACAGSYTCYGQTWMKSVSKCLQLSLALLLRPWVKPTCQDIHHKALDSHTSCFLDPAKQRTPTICSVNCNDYFKIFWTTRESFIGGLDTAWESIRAMWNIGVDCGDQSISKCFEQTIQGAMRIAKIKILRFGNSSVNFPYGKATNRLVDKIGASIAKRFNWDTKFMGWLAFPVEESSLVTESLDIILALVDKTALGIVHAVLVNIDFVYIFNKFALKINRGTLSLTPIDGISYWVKTLDRCSDRACIKTTPLAITERPNHDDDRIYRNITTVLLSAVAKMYGLAAAATLTLINCVVY